MKFLTVFAFCTVSALCTPAMARTQGEQVSRPDQMIIAHSGGCRKSSPPGKCCHGGSQPVHCH